MSRPERGRARAVSRGRRRGLGRRASSNSPIHAARALLALLVGVPVTVLVLGLFYAMSSY